MLYIYALQSQKGLARYHVVILYHDCFDKVLASEIFYYDSLVDNAIYMNEYNFQELSFSWLVMIFAENLGSLYTYTRTKEFVEVFLYHFQFVI